MTGDEVFVAYRKYDGALHWHQTMRRLGEDRHGVWLGAGAGTTVRRGDGPLKTLEHGKVILISPGSWWTASFNGPPARLEIYCDITTPPTWPHPGEVTMVDLDLDVVRFRHNGSVALLDEDEFAEHRIRYGYPPEVIAAALRAATWLHTAIGSGAEPFASEHQSWLSKV
ncbi:protein associated with RNAse G/E [Allocatelliglobosispora scoriae]|uniref:Protein associated with RNAse G/E n=1 Tax=Allocatelliglobosispora scoriae TaxID=643052 RepID=A0A841C0J5_9ACTN|nr:DUF402 domain-containing protein [Allocatelliglobosispora scoriae]MBB5872869.1 protein associated with RNAse G/E [Allocatelliglobosispora scoriae]